MVPVRETVPQLMSFTIKPFGRGQLVLVWVAAAR